MQAKFRTGKVKLVLSTVSQKFKGWNFTTVLGDFMNVCSVAAITLPTLDKTSFQIKATWILNSYCVDWSCFAIEIEIKLHSGGDKNTNHQRKISICCSLSQLQWNFGCSFVHLSLCHMFVYLDHNHHGFITFKHSDYNPRNWFENYF